MAVLRGIESASFSDPELQMTPVLDVRTLVLIYVGIRIGQAAVLVYLWRVQRNYPPARYWALGSLLSASGLFLVALRTQAPVWITDVAANALLLPGWMIFDYGIIKAARLKPLVRFWWAFGAIALAVMTWFSVVTPNYPAQVLTQNLLFVGFDLYAACVCLTVSETRRAFTFKLIGGLLLLSALVCTWRVAGGVFGMTLGYSATLPRLFWIATSIVIFPMITMLLSMHTSQRLQDEINHQALHDTLTGAYNRRAFDEFANREWSRAVRHGYPFSVLTVDIDHFKRFNDQHGHQIGDATLVAVSNVAQTALRSNDIWCRYGGEEFVALLPNTTIDHAIAVAERLRTSVEETTITSASGLLNVSVSIGVAERSLDHATWAEVLAVSDTALYQAKAAGRNRVAVARNAVSGASI